MKKSRLPAYAIVRVDTFLPSSESARNRITVTWIVWGQELAESEVARLNALGVADCEYFWQYTRADVMPDYDAIVDRLLIDAADDWVGVWEFPSMVRELGGASTPEEVLQVSLRVIRTSLDQGLLEVGDVTEAGFRSWSTSPADACQRIEQEWRRFPEGPRLGDISCWFNLTPAGLSYLSRKVTSIYVRLLGEGVDVWRPVQAVHVSGNIYRVRPQPYDRALENWEFEPGETVVCDYIESADGHILSATGRASNESA